MVAMTIMVASVDAFVVQGHCSSSSSRTELGMVGGRGWDNDDFLIGLSGARGGGSRGGIPQSQERMDLNDLVPNDPPVFDVKPGTGGGSRMAQMMAKAEQMKKMGRMNSMMGGFEQKFAVPVEDDEEGKDGDNFL